MTVRPHPGRAQRHRSIPRILVPAVALAVVLVPLGCSSGDDSASTRSSAESVTTAPGDGTVVGPTTTGAPATAPGTAPVADVVKDPVAEGTPASLGGDVTVTLVDSETLDVGAQVPGETAGPAVAATLEVRNGSDGPFDLSSLAVTASYGDGTPAIGNRSEPAHDLSGSIEAGATASGVYVFRAPQKQADSVIIEVQSADRPNVVRFRVS